MIGIPSPEGPYTPQMVVNVRDQFVAGDAAALERALRDFLGSGTAVIAAERSGRRCYGIELDPLYVDTIICR